jgi:hypothetical protein
LVTALHSPELPALYAENWLGEPRLKEIAASAVHRTAEVSTRRALRDLNALGVLTAAQVSAWETLHNAVMHGSLMSPYSSEEDDARLLALASMMHALTREPVRRSAQPIDTKAE